jgi:hypothetical protein
MWEQDGCTKVGLPPIRLHDVRHSYATAALAAGIPAKIVSERRGHANVQTTLDTYSHVIRASTSRRRRPSPGSSSRFRHRFHGLTRQRCCHFCCQTGDAFAC